MAGEPFVPADFEVPVAYGTTLFRLEPLGPEHNGRDYDAWTSSMGHIHSTPGWGDSRWPHEMTLDENRSDLEGHADDFARRVGFTYSVLGAGHDVVGCVYIYPARDGTHDAHVQSWVRADRAELDRPLWKAVSGWLASVWPFKRVDYAERA